MRTNKIFLYFLGFFLVFCILTEPAALTFAAEKNGENGNPADKNEDQYVYGPAQTAVCQYPIPIGRAWHYVLGIMHDVYENLKQIKTLLDLAVKELLAFSGELKENPKVCDFRKCMPVITNQGPEFSLKVSYIFGTKTLLNGRLPICRPHKCQGNPCPDPSRVLKTLEDVKKSIAKNREAIRDIFTKKTEDVLEEIRKRGESSATKISRFETALRLLKAARYWLHPSMPGEAGVSSCVLNRQEKAMAEEGEIGNVYMMNCIKAIEADMYWPKPWSKTCAKKCSGKSLKNCIDCLGSLASCSEKSTLARINCRIYHFCKEECANGLTDSCLECLCVDENGYKLSTEECTDWFCGGSAYNYVCCYEPPLKK